MKLNNTIKLIITGISIICLFISTNFIFSTPEIINKAIALFSLFVFILLTLYTFRTTNQYNLLDNNNKDLFDNIYRAVSEQIKSLLLALVIFLLLFQGLQTNIQKECNDFIYTEYLDCFKDVDGVIICGDYIDTQLLPFDMDNNIEYGVYNE